MTLPAFEHMPPIARARLTHRSQLEPSEYVSGDLKQMAIEASNLLPALVRQDKI